MIEVMIICIFFYLFGGMILGLLPFVALALLAIPWGKVLGMLMWMGILLWFAQAATDKAD